MVVAIYTVLFLRLRIFKHEVLGVILISVGIAIVGVFSILYEADSAKNPKLGFIIMIISQFFIGGVSITEQKFFKHVKVHPLQAVGIEGFTGFMYCLCMLPILNLIPCDYQDLCSEGYVENSIDAFQQIGDNPYALALLLGLILIAGVFNFTGAAITKKIGALSRTSIDACRTLFVWGFSVLFGWERFIPGQLAGFVLIVLGTAIFNEILRIPWFGFKEAIEERRVYKKNRRTRDSYDKLFIPGAVLNDTDFTEASPRAHSIHLRK